MAGSGWGQEACQSSVVDGTLRTVAAASATKSRALRITARALALESRELRHHANAKLGAGSQRFLPQRTADQPEPGVAGRRVGAASTAPDEAFAQAGRRGHGPDPRGHAGALPRTLRRNAGRSGVGGAGRSSVRS